MVAKSQDKEQSDGRVQNVRKRSFGSIIRAILSISLVAVLVYHIGSGEIIGHLRAVSWQALAGATLVLATSVFLVTPRWAVILSTLGYKIPSASLLPSVFLGFLCNQVLPTGVGGDALRAWRARQFGVPFEIGIYSVLLDRISGVFTVLMGTIVLAPFAAPLAAHRDFLWVAGTVVVGGIVGCLGLWAMSVLPPSRFPLMRALQQAIAGFNVSLRALVRRPQALLGVIVLSVVGQFIAAGAIGLLAHTLQIRISPIDVMVVTFGATLAATIPISIAGWGVREGALIFLLGLYGVTADTAFALSVLYGACLTLASAPGALTLLGGRVSAASPGRSPPE